MEKIEETERGKICDTEFQNSLHSWKMHIFRATGNSIMPVSCLKSYGIPIFLTLCMKPLVAKNHFFSIYKPIVGKLP